MSEIIEQFNKASQNAYRNWRQLADINTDLVRRLTNIQLNLASVTVNNGIQQGKLLGESSNYKTLLRDETELNSNYGNKVLELTRETLDVLNESRDEVMGWVEDTVNDINSQFASRKGGARTADKKVA